jgi:hypothetical protein
MSADVLTFQDFEALSRAGRIAYEPLGDVVSKTELKILQEKYPERLTDGALSNSNFDWDLGRRYGYKPRDIVAFLCRKQHLETAINNGIPLEKASWPLKQKWSPQSVLAAWENASKDGLLNRPDVIKECQSDLKQLSTSHFGRVTQALYKGIRKLSAKIRGKLLHLVGKIEALS